MRDVVIRWTPNRKIELVKAVRENVISVEAAIAKYHLTLEEFSRWMTLFELHGANGLRVTRTQNYNRL